MGKAGVVFFAIAIGAMVGLLIAAASPLYVVAGLAGLGVATALVVNMQVGLLAFVTVATLLPYAVIPLPIGGVRLTFIDAILTALLLMWLVRLLVRPGTKLESVSWGWLVVLFICLAITSYTIGTGYSTSPEATRLFLKLINSVLLFFTVLNCVRSKVQLQQIVAGLIFGGAVAAVIGIILFALPKGEATRWLMLLRPLGYYQSGGDALRFIAGTETERAIGTSVDPNVFGALLMLCLVLAVSQLLSSRPVISRNWLIPLSGLIFACLLLTLSRGSWMGFIAAMFFIATIKNRRLWFLFALGVGVFYFGLVPTDIPFVSHLLSGFAARDQAAAMRLGEYKDAIQLISRYPWFGVGFGSAPSADLYVGVSSVFLLIAEQMGLIGLAGFLATMSALFISTLKRLEHIADVELQGTLLGLLAALAAALFAGIFDHHYFDIRFPHVAALFWMLAGLLAVGLKLDEAREQS